ncbi:2-amino-3,7-dideoxy-D-threo-hept-6-ulosonate synthase [Amycolatopsis sp. NPDC004079]|uniref:2-amino-3,7-dideoxy-D-threo-hept-6-ulosonate synthase n=1 Tax=Amycolatopsis sp. NPDC004079 TaxID=3154549 RepID=UPI0033A04F5D
MSLSLNGSFARRLRTLRLYKHHDERLLVIPLDHPVGNGPVTGGRRVNQLVEQIAASGADAVVLHKGSLRYVNPRWFARVSLIVHLSASTVHATDPDAKYLVAGVEEALRLGADAISVHVNLGSSQEKEQIRDLAAVSDACDRWNIPLLAMMYARGPKIANPYDPGLVAHAAAVATDLGADLVKLDYVGDAVAMREIVDTCPVPVVVAGGPVREGEALTRHVEQVLSCGVAGLAIGRNVFTAADPAAVTQLLSGLVHPASSPSVPALDAPLTRIGALT